MKRTAAILGSCLKFLALVDAIAISKVRVSRHNVGWENVEYWLPDDQPDNLFKNYPFSNNHLDEKPMQSSIDNVQYRTEGTPSVDLSYGGLMGQLPNAELAFNTPSQNLIPPNRVYDNWQRKSINNDPYIKLNLKLKLPLSSGLGDINVSEPEYEAVINKESQLTKRHPGSTPSLDSFVKAYDTVDHVSKNLPEPVENVGKYEKLHHSDRSPVPFEVQQTTNSEDILPGEKLENGLTDQVDAFLDYFDKFQQLKDALTKLSENATQTEYDQSSSETKSQLGDQNATPALDPSVVAYETIDHFSKNLPDSVEKVGESEKLHFNPYSYKSQEEAKPSDVQTAGLVEEEFFPDTAKIEAWLNYVNKLQQLKDIMDNYSKTAAPTDQNEFSTEKTKKLHESDNENEDDRKFAKLHHSRRPIPYTEMTLNEKQVEDKIQPKTTENYDYLNAHPKDYQKLTDLDKLLENPVQTEPVSLTKTSEIESSKHLSGEQTKRPDFESRRFQKLNNSRRTIPYPSQEMEKPDDSIDLQPKPAEDSPSETTQVETYLSKLQRPVDILNKPSEKATQIVHDGFEPTDKKRQSSEHLPGRQMVVPDPDNFEIKESGQYEEMYYPPMAVPDIEKSVFTPINVYSRFARQPVDVSNEPLNKATQTFHDEYKPTETKSLSTENPHGEPLNEPFDDFWSELYNERKTSPMFDLEDQEKIPEPLDEKYRSNEALIKEDEKESLFSRIWQRYGW